DGRFYATMFYADIEGHPGDDHVSQALEELHFYSEELRIIGTYPAAPFREQLSASGSGGRKPRLDS
ncbi:MAG: hypothetical protein AAGJ94_03935, partial [Pseudomonadota bacterium]